MSFQDSATTDRSWTLPSELWTPLSPLQDVQGSPNVPKPSGSGLLNTSQTSSISIHHSSKLQFGDQLTDMILHNNLAYEDIILAGLEAISRKSNHTMSLPKRSPALFSAFIPSPLHTHIPVHSVSLMAVCKDNQGVKASYFGQFLE
jgi:hypothetical protein